MNSAQRPANSQRQIRKIQTAAEDILDSAEYRQHQQQQHSKGAIHSTIYELAKSAETNERNLPKAVELYAEAASKGEKIDSCIKDFASILHQMGETEIAVKFLKDARPYYHGDLPKFDRLMTTLEKQLAPSGKHHCKTLLLELPKPEEPSEELIQSMFTNVTRIKAVRAYNHLDFSQEPE